MKDSSRAMVLTGPRKMEMRSFPLPEIGDEDGLLKVELVGVCGSDPGIYEGRTTRGPRPYPLIMGHEIVGRVVEMGQAAGRRLGVGKGDRVVVEYAFGCGLCEACLSGDYRICEKKYSYGSMISCQDPPHLFGGYSEYLYIHPRAMVHRIGDGISPEVGVLICAVLGNALRWLGEIGGVSIGDAVAILGPGQQGIAGAVVARECGADPVFVIGLERDRARLETARRFGADRVILSDLEDPVEVISKATGGRMARVVMDVTGSTSGAESALTLAGRGATIVLPGIYKGRKAALDLDRVVLNEISLVGVFSHDFRSVEKAVALARKGRYPLEDLITHRFSLDDAEEAVRLAAGETGGEAPVKVVIDPWM
jgi:alcohol dehydrogenase